MVGLALLQAHLSQLVGHAPGADAARPADRDALAVMQDVFPVPAPAYKNAFPLPGQSEECPRIRTRRNGRRLLPGRTIGGNPGHEETHDGSLSVSRPEYHLREETTLARNCESSYFAANAAGLSGDLFQERSQGDTFEQATVRPVEMK